MKPCIYGPALHTVSLLVASHVVEFSEHYWPVASSYMMRMQYHTIWVFFGISATVTIVILRFELLNKKLFVLLTQEPA